MASREYKPGLGSFVRNYFATIVAGILVAGVLAASFVLVYAHGLGAAKGSRIVRVHDGDGHVYEYSLSEDGEHTIVSSYGSNTILVEDDTVRMIDANCPNQSCMHQRAISGPGAQIICLPHKLWVEVVDKGESEGEQDASELDEGLVEWLDGADKTEGSGESDGSSSWEEDLDVISR